MKEKRYLIFVLSLILLLFSSNALISRKAPIGEVINEKELSQPYPETSSLNNRLLIDSLFDLKRNEYDSLGYFPTLHESSIQAVYYALSIFESLENLDSVNHSEIINYIMKFYDPISHTFIDKLANRYLDTDFTLNYFYPLSSVLEVTCYAILSLKILNRLDLIDVQESINFVWDCFNDDSEGFIGQVYKPELSYYFKVPTIDNTYHAVLVLDLLMGDWTGFTSEMESIIRFVNGLQLPNGTTWDSGGFFNDNDFTFDTLAPFFEPNLLSSYYSIKTLEILGMEDTIRRDDFRQFLEYLYDSKNDCFRMSEWDYGFNYTNIVATALGLELSEIMGFSGFDSNMIASFLLSNRNSIGNWDGSTLMSTHELIDTFQIMRSLNNSGFLSLLSLSEKNEIKNATQLYRNNEGYSLLSRDCTSMNQLYSIISSFRLYGKWSDLDIQQVYLKILKSYNYNPITTNSFSGYLSDTQGVFLLRSHPIEYYSSGKKQYIDETNQLKSHKSTYHALEALKGMFKLGDFASEYDLTDLLDDILATQFLNESFINSFGAFTPLWSFNNWPLELLDKKIYFEYSYYAIRCLEIISDCLGLNGLSNLGINEVALYNYIDKNIVETPNSLYFEPFYTSDTEITLEYTYYMIYVLKAMDAFSKNTNKIKDFVLSKLDYTNFKNIYYCYKISEILNLEIDFDAPVIQQLVQELHDDEFGEFYLTTERETIEQEVFLWTCDMARNSESNIEVNYSNVVLLGGYNNISASLYNLVLWDFKNTITFKFESAQIGSFPFRDYSDIVYAQNVHVPFSIDNYPKVTGNLSAYEGYQLKARIEITFQTSYALKNYLKVTHNSSTLVILTIKSLIEAQRNYSLPSGSARARIFTSTNEQTKYFSHDNFSTYSLFTLNYTPPEDGEYHMEIYLNDGFGNGQVFIGNLTSIKKEPSEDPIVEKETLNLFPVIPLVGVLILVPGSVIFISTKQLKKKRAA